MSCLNSYNTTLAECPNTIQVWAGLAPNTNYAWLLTDKHGNEYYEYVVTDSNGAFVIDCTSDIFPDGLFNHYAGTFTLEVFKYFPYTYIEEQGVTLTFCGDTFDSILFTFVKSRTTQQTINQHIKCQ